MGSHSNSRSPGIVRNISLPVLQQYPNMPLSPHVCSSTSTRPVPRVSSFSKMYNPPPHNPRRLRHIDEEEQQLDDGLVPQLDPTEHFVILSRRHSPPPHPGPPTPGVGRVPRLRGRFTEDVSSEGDEVGSNSWQDISVEQQSMEGPTSLSASTQLNPISASNSLTCIPHTELNELDSARFPNVLPIISGILCVLDTFVPPDIRASSTGKTALELKFLFLSAVSFLVLPLTMCTSLLLPPTAALYLSLLAISLAPVLSRVTRSILFSTLVLLCGLVVHVVAVARNLSPVALVWASIVPIVTFTTLGNRAGLASSGVMAATIFTADFSSIAATGGDVHALVIASWVLFLGCAGVLQTQIRAMALRRCGAAEQPHVMSEIGRNSHEWELQVADYGQVPDAMVLPSREELPRY